MTPTTTPAAMPAVLAPFDGLLLSAGTGAGCVWPGAVTTTVLARVMVEGGLSLVVSGCTTTAGASLEGLLLAAADGVVDGEVEAVEGEGVAFGGTWDWT